MKENFDKSLRQLLIHEGGFSDHRDDPGGATMKGVTLTTFQRHFGATQTVDNLRNITDEQLAHIYRTGYWDKSHCDQLPPGVDYAVFDAAVNSGPKRAAKWLQGTIGSDQDGLIGPDTLRKVEERELPVVINGLCDLRLQFVQRLKIFPTFGKGLSRRIKEVRHVALDMVDGKISEEIQVADFQMVKRGSRGDWVIKLQQELKVDVDGIFGRATDAALRTFQQEQGLEVDGIAGRDTYRALGLIP